MLAEFLVQWRSCLLISPTGPGIQVARFAGQPLGTTPLNLTPSSILLPPMGEKVPEGRLRGVRSDSWSQGMRNNEWSLSMNLARMTPGSDSAEDSKSTALRKRRSTATLQNAGALVTGTRASARFWSAPLLRRFGSPTRFILPAEPIGGKHCLQDTGSTKAVLLSPKARRAFGD